MVKTASVEVEVKVPAHQLWAALKDSANLLPKIAPDFISSLEIVEGKPGEIGSIRLIKFGTAAPPGAFVKEKLVKWDEAEHVVGTKELEGGLLLAGYTQFAATTKLSKNEGGTLVSWSAEYDYDSEPKKPIEGAKEGTIKLFKGLESYLLATNEYL